MKACSLVETLLKFSKNSIICRTLVAVAHISYLVRSIGLWTSPKIIFIMPLGLFLPQHGHVLNLKNAKEITKKWGDLLLKSVFHNLNNQNLWNWLAVITRSLRPAKLCNDNLSHTKCLKVICLSPLIQVREQLVACGDIGKSTGWI